MRRRGGGIGPACAWPDTPALLAHSGGRFHWAGDESRLTYAWAKWDDGDRAFHGHDYRRRNIALRPIAEYLGGGNTRNVGTRNVGTRHLEKSPLGEPTMGRSGRRGLVAPRTPRALGSARGMLARPPGTRRVG